MRCNEVIHELAVPTDARDSRAIDEHLARCPACAAWVERARGLDRIWAATQPPEPTPQVWDALWARLAASLDVSTPKQVTSHALFSSMNGSTTRPHLKPLSTPLPRSRVRTLAVIGLIGLAQAAAVLLAVGLSWNTSDPDRPAQIAKGPVPAASSLLTQSADVSVNPSLVVPRTVEIDEGQLVVVVIRNQGKNSTIIDRTPDVTFLEVDDISCCIARWNHCPRPRLR